MPRGFAPSLVLAGLGLILIGCGYKAADDAASGGLLGVGAGAAVGALTGADLLTAAVVGGAIGAAGGALINSKNVSLGRPVRS